MAKSIMIQGTMSNVGKSIITAGLCRIFKQDGYKVAPFKSQNMALNSFVTEDGLEIGRAQAVQAECCELKPDIRMNPILLKPTTDHCSQVIVNGEVYGNMSAREYFKFKVNLKANILKAYESLCRENDIIVIEGAGSPAEINLKKDDIVNMGIAKLTNSPVILVGDIDRGGIFASLYGTIKLLESDEVKYIKSIIINKFRGDKNLLYPGIKMLEELVDISVCGIVPYTDINIDDEDSLSDRFLNNKKNNSLIDIVVIKLPKISNFTDFTAFENINGVNLRYAKNSYEIGNPDLIIIPGSKNTIEDLKWLRNNKIEKHIIELYNNKIPIIGICGGFQMLGLKIKDCYNQEGGGIINGLGLLKFDTVFEKIKTRNQVKGKLNKIDGFFKELSYADFKGYEIHMSNINNNRESKNICDKFNYGFYNENVFGTYIHGFFDNIDVIKGLVKCICNNKNIDYTKFEFFDNNEYKQTQYNVLAETLRDNLNINNVYEIIKKGI